MRNRAYFIVEQLLGDSCYLALCEGMVSLTPLRHWSAFCQLDKHGLQQYAKRVDFADRPYFIDILIKLNTFLLKNRFEVPSGDWCLKMPLGYGVLGKGRTGNSVKEKHLSATVPVIDNPAMTPAENAKWGKTL